MGIEDEKTRPAVRAVKRREHTPVAELPTRKVKAVQRKAPPGLPVDCLAEVPRVLVLPRGELLNAAGEADNGWVVRDEAEKSECLRFVLVREGLGTTLSRAVFGEKAYHFDLMQGDRSRGGLVLDAVVGEFVGGRRRLAPREGSGHLFDLLGGRQAGFVLRPEHQVICLDAKSQVVFESVPTAEGARVMARRRTVATVTRLEGRRVGLEVALEAGATPLERLLLVAGLALCEAFLIERQSAGGKRAGEVDLLDLLGLSWGDKR